MNDPPNPRSVKFLVFSASMRHASLNTRLARLAANSIRGNGGVVDHASMTDFDAASYNGDIEASNGLPPGAVEFRRRLEDCDGFVIAAPEYNGSMPGLLKNAIDWVSRSRPQPFNERHGLLLSASPSMIGGNRGLWALRIPLEHLGARIFPNMFSLARAHEAFTDDGQLRDEELQQRFNETIISFMDLVEASTHYQCIKRAWIEFLGERVDPAIDRVDQPSNTRG